MVKQTPSFVVYAEKPPFVVTSNLQMADDSELANPFIVAVFTVISNLAFICSGLGLFNIETDDQ